jgi:hypothetical protein
VVEKEREEISRLELEKDKLQIRIEELEKSNQNFIEILRANPETK